jgi:transposase-like protein
MPKRVSAEEKERAVKQFIAGKRSAQELGAWLGVDRNQVYRWEKAYRTQGVEGLKPHHAQHHGKMPKYSREKKEEAVKAYLAGAESQKEICKRFGIRSTHALRNWIKVYNAYNAHGDFNSRKRTGGGSYMKQGRSTTQEERIQIAKECLESGKNYGEIALKYNVSYQQARTWALRFEELGEAGLEDRRGKRKKDQTPRTELEAAQIEIEQLKHKLYLAEMERDLLKKLDEIERRDASQE